MCSFRGMDVSFGFVSDRFRMVVHDRALRQTPWDEWRALLVACHDYAVISGWRFVNADFMNLSQKRHEKDGLNAARERGLPMALEYADRIRACVEATRSGAPPPRLVEEFQACQRLVSQEAVYNSMIATVKAIGLGEPAPAAEAASAAEEGDALAYQDMSQPIEVIARRLIAYHTSMQDSPGMLEERQERLLHASFIVEFGLEHGLPEMRDSTSEATLTDFMTRLGEWEGARSSGDTGALVRSLVLGNLPDGPMKPSLRNAVLDWVCDNKALVIGGGVLVGTLLSVVVAGAAIAAASSARRR